MFWSSARIAMAQLLTRLERAGAESAGARSGSIQVGEEDSARAERAAGLGEGTAGEADLPHRVAVAEGDGPVLEAVVVDGDRERGADLVLAPVPPGRSLPNRRTRP